MDLISLTNLTGKANAGNPQNLRHKKTTRPIDSNRPSGSADLYGDFEVSTISMKTPVFADVMRQAYERRAALGK